jgi:hypothetical protein
VLAGCGWDAHRRRDRELSRLATTAAVGLLAGLTTAGRASASLFGVPPPHQFRWLWPMGAFATFVVVATLARRFGRPSARAAALVGGFAAITAALVALNLPTGRESPTTPAWSIPGSKELGRQMAGLEGHGTLLVDIREDLGDPYGVAMMAELQRRGVPFVVEDPILVRQLGPERRFTGSNAQATLFLRGGDRARVGPPGARRVAIVEGLDAAEQRELAGLEERIGEYIRDQGLRLNRRGRAAVKRGVLQDPAGEATTEGVDPEPLFRSGALADLVRAEVLALDEPWARRFERYADLHEQWDRRTAALFLRPIATAAAPPDPQP